MKSPAFIAEALAPANRSKLRFGIYTGYALAIGFAMLAGAAAMFELTPWRWAFVGLISTKVLTNSVVLGRYDDNWLGVVQRGLPGVPG